MQVTIEEQMTTADRERALVVATVIAFRNAIDNGADLFDLIDTWQNATGCTLDEDLINEMDRQGIIWI